MLTRLPALVLLFGPRVAARFFCGCRDDLAKLLVIRPDLLSFSGSSPLASLLSLILACFFLSLLPCRPVQLTPSALICLCAVAPHFQHQTSPRWYPILWVWWIRSSNLCFLAGIDFHSRAACSSVVVITLDPVYPRLVHSVFSIWVLRWL